MPNSALVWFRRDLRDEDHAALSHALRRHARVFCVFVFDRDILDTLPQRRDRRVAFIHASVVALDAALRQRGGGLIVRQGCACDTLVQLALTLGVAAVYANHDYEPSAVQRDEAVCTALRTAGIAFHSFKDQVIFEKSGLLTGGGKPYGVFTPYKNAWRKALTPAHLAPYPVAPYADRLAPPPRATPLPSLDDLGFEPVALTELAPGMKGAHALWARFQPRMAAYDRERDAPARDGTSRLSPHLRFGTLSIRELVRTAFADPGSGAQTWLDELIWREFYQQVLWHRPDVVTRSFRTEFDNLRWEEGAEADRRFAAWRAGQTGYPIVDAALRELAETGHLHNRLRMITASFLTKDIGIHWLRGERHFAALLNDYDLAANNGGWQWAASTGCDAQPYFRIFNPTTQSEKFDPQGEYIRRWVPELAGLPPVAIHAPATANPVELASAGVVLGRDYPWPIIDHGEARAQTLTRFKQIRPA